RPVYEPKYKTIAHETLKLEAAMTGGQPDYKALDDIIDAVGSRITLRKPWTEADAVAFSQAVLGYLRENGFIYVLEHWLLSETLTPRKLDADMKRWIRDFDTSQGWWGFFGKSSSWGKAALHGPKHKRHVLAHLDDDFHFYQCATLTYLLLGVGEGLDLPLRPVREGAHLFVRWHFADGSHLNVLDMPDELMKVEFNISDEAIRSGASLRSLRQGEVLSDIILSTALTLEQTDRDMPGKTLEAINRAIKLSPTNVEALQVRGHYWLSQLGQDRWDKAIADLTAAIKLDPNSAHSYSLRAEAWAGKGDLDKAIVDLTKAVELEPKQSRWRRERARMWRSKGKLGEAMADLDRAIELDPVGVYFSRGVARWEAGEREAACADFVKAAEARAGGVDIVRGFGVDLFRWRRWLGGVDYEKGIEFFDLFLKCFPTDHVAYTIRANARLKQAGAIYGSRDAEKEAALRKAVEDYTMAIKHSPRWAVAHVNRGMAWTALKQCDKAVADLSRAIALDPKDPFAYQNRAYARAEAGDLEGATEDLYKAVEVFEKWPTDALRFSIQGAVQDSDDAALLGSAFKVFAGRAERHWLRVQYRVGGARDLAIANVFAQEAAKCKSPDPSIHVLRAKIAGELRDFDGVIASLTKALAAQPRSDVYKARAEARARQGDRKGALSDYDSALKLDPKDHAAYELRAEVRADLGDDDGAIEDCNRAIALSPEYAPAYNRRGISWSAKEAWDRALDDFNKAIALNPKDIRPYGNRGALWMDRDEPRKAVEDFSEVLRRAPTHAWALRHRGEAWRLLKEYDKSIADYTSAIKVKPGVASAYKGRGMARCFKRELDGAIADLTAAADIEADDGTTYDYRGKCWLLKREYDKAIADFTKLIALRPTSSSAYYLRGRAWGSKGDRGKAIADYSKAIELDPKSGKALKARGRAYESRGDFAKAVADLEKAQELLPQDRVVANCLAWIYVSVQQQRKPARALALAQRVVKSKRLAPYLDTLACAYAEHGEFAKAIEAEEEALRLASDAEERASYKDMIEAFKERKTYLEHKGSR
ncbi:tetratricopeptide repeat protein, partial [Planctomycetota bacterium]